MNSATRSAHLSGSSINEKEPPSEKTSRLNSGPPGGYLPVLLVKAVAAVREDSGRRMNPVQVLRHVVGENGPVSGWCRNRPTRRPASPSWPSKAREEWARGSVLRKIFPTCAYRPPAAGPAARLAQAFSLARPRRTRDSHAARRKPCGRDGGPRTMPRLRRRCGASATATRSTLRPSTRSTRLSARSAIVTESGGGSDIP